MKMREYSVHELDMDVGKLYSEGVKKGLPLPWVGMRNLFSVCPEQFTLVTGVPGSGKSEWLDALIVELLRSNPRARVAYYSPENRPYSLHVAKLLAKYVGKPFHDGPTPRMSKTEAADATRWLVKHVSFIEDVDISQSIFDILNGDKFPIKDVFWWQPGHARFNNSFDSPFFLVIDPWNFLEKPKQRDETEADYLSAALGAVDKFVHDTGAHVFIVAHPKVINREKDGTRPIPTPYDVSGGAHWFNKCDNIICVHRVDKTNPALGVEIHVQKVRFSHIGEEGLCKLDYDKTTGRYRDRLEVARNPYEVPQEMNSVF